MGQIFWVMINSAVSFAYLFVISKILGKKQIAQLEFIDYTVGISLGSISAEMSTSSEPFYYYILAMTIFFLLALFVAFLGRKSPIFKKILKGKPSTLIYDGKINYKQICRNNIDINDLLSMLREQGFFDINKVAYAIFEPSGNISVLPKGEFEPVVIGDIKPESVTTSELTPILVVDGKISKSSLNELNKNVDWLLKNLNFSSKKQLKTVALAVYDSQNQKVVAHFKDEKL